jgi:hypothetical protein
MSPVAMKHSLPANFPRQGLKEVIPRSSTIYKYEDSDGEEGIENTANIMKIRFTKKQWKIFISACRMFKQLSEDPAFPNYVSYAMRDDIKTNDIATHLVSPIIQAPSRLQTTKSKKDKTKSDGDVYFTKEKTSTDAVRKLYNAVKPELDESKLRYNQTSVTCPSDIRSLLSMYITKHNLKKDDGTHLDKFLKEIAPNTLHEMDIIQRNDRRTIMIMVKEISGKKTFR